jgi:NADPH-dependent curcumin reductase CurA
MSEQQQFVLQDYAQGDFDPAILSYQAGDIPTPAEGQALVKTLYLSLDPTNRVWLSPDDTYLPKIELGAPMRGLVLGRVVESKAEAFQAGDIVYGLGLWQEYCAIDAPLLSKANPLEGVSLDNYANLYSAIGATSYVGIVDIGRPEAGDTVLVSGAAGATGALACQIAKNLGCKVVGIAGGEEKCQYLLGIGCDGAIDYKAGKLYEDLARLCPEGINVFFDNVGGEMLDTIIGQHMALNSTVVLCGAISQYGNATDPDKQYHFKNILSIGYKRIRLEGFVILDYADRYDEIYKQLGEWNAEGTLIPRSHILDGLEQAPKALQMVLQGKNHGKMMVKVAQD